MTHIAFTNPVTRLLRAGALLLGLWFLRSAFVFLDPARRETEAKRLFFISIAHLPLLLGLLVADRMIFKL